MPNIAQAIPARHKPVLLNEVVEALSLKSGETFVDATYGRGGHSRAVADRYPDIHIIAIDQDPVVEPNFEFRNSKFEFRRGNFRDLNRLLEGIRPDAILMDLGFSSDQLESVPGLSFLRDEPLDMRLSRSGLTAADIVNTFDEHAIELILRGFGEERNSRRIAKAIVASRPLNTSTDLVKAVESVVPRRGRIHPATKTFQALRIAVNKELESLEEGLEKGFRILNPGGRLAVISFHSLEDRIVKNFFRDKAREGFATVITKKLVVPTRDEIVRNPRSRSAKLRILQKNV